MRIRSEGNSKVYELDEKSLPAGSEFEKLCDFMRTNGADLRTRVAVAAEYFVKGREAEYRVLRKTCEDSVGSGPDREHLQIRLAAEWITRYMCTGNEQHISKSIEIVNGLDMVRGVKDEEERRKLRLLKAFLMMADRRRDLGEVEQAMAGSAPKGGQFVFGVLGNLLVKLKASREEEALKLLDETRMIEREPSRIDFPLLKMLAERTLGMEEASKTHADIERRIQGRREEGNVSDALEKYLDHCTEYANFIEDPSRKATGLDGVMQAIRAGSSAAHRGQGSGGGEEQYSQGDVGQALRDFLQALAPRPAELESADIILGHMKKNAAFEREVLFELGKFLFGGGKYSKCMHCLPSTEGSPAAFRVRRGILKIQCMLSLPNSMEEGALTREISLLGEDLHQLEKSPHLRKKVLELEERLELSKLTECIRNRSALNAAEENGGYTREMLLLTEKVMRDGLQHSADGRRFWRVEIGEAEYKYYNKLGNFHFTMGDLLKARECYSKALSGSRADSGLIEKNIHALDEYANREEARIGSKAGPGSSECISYLAYLCSDIDAKSKGKGATESEYIDEVFRAWGKGERSEDALEGLERAGVHELRSNPGSKKGAKILSVCALLKFEAADADAVIRATMKQHAALDLDLAYNYSLYLYKKDRSLEGVYQKYKESRREHKEPGRRALQLMIEALYLFDLIKRHRFKKFQEELESSPKRFEDVGARNAWMRQARSYIGYWHIWSKRSEALFSIRELEESGAKCDQLRSRLAGEDRLEGSWEGESAAADTHQAAADGGADAGIRAKREELIRLMTSAPKKEKARGAASPGRRRKERKKPVPAEEGQEEALAGDEKRTEKARAKAKRVVESDEEDE